MSKPNRIDSQLAAELIGQSGVRTVVVTGLNGYGFCDGDILMRFVLPDRREVLYTAEQESDYYGGHYDRIAWFLRPAPTPSTQGPK